MSPPNYAAHFSTLTTPQKEKARKDQVANHAGGFVFTLDKWARLDRWLLLGADGNTYYATEREMTRENAGVILECLAEDGLRTVRTIVEISEAGRAPKNDPAIFALAMAAGDSKLDTRRAALQALPKVCRIGTHLFHFVRDVEQFRRWGRGLVTAVSKWYTEKAPKDLAYQVLKYQQRDKWGHRDVLRLSHAKAPTPEHNAIFRWCIGGGLDERQVKRRLKSGETRSDTYAKTEGLPAMLAAYEELKASPDTATTVRLIGEHGFTHEMVPSEHKGSPEVWEALLEGMPQTALIRNLAKMTAVGLFKPFSPQLRMAADRIADEVRLRRARVHPIALLSALRVYAQGHGEKGKLTWTPAREITDALDAAFYMAFQTIEPTGKNALLALDVSGSMACGTIAGIPGLTPREASAAMAMVTARTEKSYAFWGFGHEFVQLTISARQRLDDVVKAISGLPFGGTDCALPMLAAAQEKWDVDVFHVYTDNETHSGRIHPFQALQQYRQKSGRAAKLAVVGFTATQFTIADPNDWGMRDFVGMDASGPALLADFARD